MNTSPISTILPIIAVVIFCISSCDADFDLTVLHTNDVHARFEQLDGYGSQCDAEESVEGLCFGGVARRVTKIREIRNSTQNVVLLDGGDQFQGTMWFFIYRGNATSYFMNLIGYDAMAIGNHEFDNTPEGLAPFLKAVNFPVLSSNIDASEEPVIDGLFHKSTVLNVSGDRIGVIGYTYSKTYEISSTGNVQFSDEIESIQREVDSLTQAGINKIIAIGHSGIKIDLNIARNVRGVDIVVGGHTDTFLYTGTPPSTEVPYGDYPQVVEQENGGLVLVVQDYTFGKYLGRLDVTFDNDGNVLNTFSGNPILLDNSVEQDSQTLADIERWAVRVRNSSSQYVGRTHAFLEGERAYCRARECNLGNLIADAMVSQNNKNPDELRWNDVGIGLMNGGSIRASIDRGDVTIGDIGTVLPFGNTVDVLELRGTHLLEALENAVMNYDLITLDGRFLQFSGMRVTFSLAREQGSRVVSALALCTNCTVPQYEDVLPDRIYKIVTNSFVANGGDGYTMIRDNKISHITGNLDASVLAEYIERLTPVAPALEGRVTVLEEEDPCTTGLATKTVSSQLVLAISSLILTVNIMRYLP